jgi:hypothetical protein
MPFPPMLASDDLKKRGFYEWGTRRGMGGKKVDLRAPRADFERERTTHSLWRDSDCSRTHLELCTLIDARREGFGAPALHSRSPGER